MIEAITFDLDDTLWDIWPTIERAEQRLHDWLSAHYPKLTARYPSPEALRELRDRVLSAQPEIAHDMSRLRQASIRLAAQDVGYCETQIDIEAAFAVFQAARNEVLFFDDALPALKQLAKQYPLAALSNGNADLERIGIDHLFSLALNPVQVGHSKPHPAMFEAALAWLQLLPNQVLHVGDDPENDIFGAEQVGLRTVWLNRSGRPWPQEMMHRCTPDLEISALDQLSARLAGAVVK